ncbi:50S ribosomal protein L11 [Candidatus Dojkabacteria bacterium]|nr:50S ribosomal protein L11 [Candidatus Dojkabacteria bacterium]
MAKEIKSVHKLYLEAAKATPGPPVGPSLSPTGINTGDFCSKFNEATKDLAGYTVPVIITIYKDRTFSLEFKTPPVSDYIRKELGIKKGSAVPNLEKVGKLTKEQLIKIAEKKMVDLNTNDIEAAIKIIAGTAKQMGVEVEI